MSATSETTLLTPNEHRVADDRRDCYWLNIVTNCAETPPLEDPIKDATRFAWYELVKAKYYWLQVNAITQPMQLLEIKSGQLGKQLGHFDSLLPVRHLEEDQL